MKDIFVYFYRNLKYNFSHMRLFEFKLSKFLKFGYFILAVFCVFGLLQSCSKSCPDEKQVFVKNMDELIIEISSIKRRKNDFDWDLIDKKMRRIIAECYPKISAQLSETESIYFWENAMGYAYVRFGEELLKKYSETDMILIKIRENFTSKKISVNPAVKRLCKEWPVLYGASEEDISDHLKDVFGLRKKDEILREVLNN